ncbi:hypothetical protein COJ90_20855 [Priestia megaterium]|uniref:hypothetical protein n=1 Tax=Priestia megaterium TaxID=1404 RepID=UPI000BF7BDD1|nr:hypothetical protein [Priestia megaterium]PFP09361.1 hypothetical protein COJ90_20855 [Priestia megaterium]
MNEESSLNNQMINSTLAPERKSKGGRTEEHLELFQVFEHYAPPAPLWGDWRVILSQLNGPQSYTIKYEPIGDTVVVGQVTYSNNSNQIVKEGLYQETTINTGNSVSNIEVRFQAILTGTAVRGTIT